MLSVLLGMAFSNEVVFLSHQLQFAALLAVLCSYVTSELQKRNFRWALWITSAMVLVLLDPLRHVVYDAQFNPATCGPPGALMSRERFFALALVCRMGQVLGNAMILATLFRSTITGLLEPYCASQDAKCT
ncbi:unnamed protein product [Effrenium voratum]|nr:unnamed protein product [Effrenium voratum]|mmetsp:Transcript_60700/g.144670  ORF Transcript_60700/g.144670 Transcript_60700/m.144670 type:complete len:131 (-) Transcript_60700:252-644(-)